MIIRIMIVIWKIRPNGRNEAHVMFGVAKYSKSPSFDTSENIEECEEQVLINLHTIQEPSGG